MAAEICNLRRERKRRVRAAAEAEAGVRRVRFGRTAVEKAVTRAENAMAERRIEAHRRALPLVPDNE